MTERSRQWRLGRNSYHLEQPDLLWVKLHGGGSLAEVTQAVELYRQLGTIQPFFVLSDMTDAENLEEEARHYIDKHVRPEWILGFIYINARLLHRATATGLLLAYELTRRERHPWREKLYFVSTPDQARLLYNRLHAQRGLVGAPLGLPSATPLHPPPPA